MSWLALPALDRRYWEEVDRDSPLGKQLTHEEVRAFRPVNGVATQVLYGSDSFPLFALQIFIEGKDAQAVAYTRTDQNDANLCRTHVLSNTDNAPFSIVLTNFSHSHQLYVPVIRTDANGDKTLGVINQINVVEPWSSVTIKSDASAGSRQLLLEALKSGINVKTDEQDARSGAKPSTDGLYLFVSVQPPTNSGAFGDLFRQTSWSTDIEFVLTHAPPALRIHGIPQHQSLLNRFAPVQGVDNGGWAPENFSWGGDRGLNRGGSGWGAGVDAVRRDIDEVRDVMVRNVDRVVDNGERLEFLSDNDSSELTRSLGPSSSQPSVLDRAASFFGLGSAPDPAPAQAPASAWSAGASSAPNPARNLASASSWGFSAAPAAPAARPPGGFSAPANAWSSGAPASAGACGFGAAAAGASSEWSGAAAGASSEWSGAPASAALAASVSFGSGPPAASGDEKKGQPQKSIVGELDSERQGLMWESRAATIGHGVRVEVSSRACSTTFDESKAAKRLVVGLSISLGLTCSIGPVDPERLMLVVAATKHKFSHLLTNDTVGSNGFLFVSDECSICLGDRPDAVFYPCRHQCCHFACLQEAKQPLTSCPQCRAPIRARVKPEVPIVPHPRPEKRSMQMVPFSMVERERQLFDKMLEVERKRMLAFATEMNRNARASRDSALVLQDKVNLFRQEVSQNLRGLLHNIREQNDSSNSSSGSNSSRSSILCDRLHAMKSTTERPANYGPGSKVVCNVCCDDVPVNAEPFLHCYTCPGYDLCPKCAQKAALASSQAS